MQASNRKGEKVLSDQSSIVTQPEVLIEEIKTSQREKVGILGGSFNPPHMGHLVIADQIKDQLDLDKIIFLPTAEPPHSSVHKTTISSDKRVDMLDLAIENQPDFDLELYEVKKGGKNYTYDTMKALMDLYPAVDFYFIIGGDMIADLPNWHEIDKLVELVQFVGVKRPGYQHDCDYPIIMVDVPTMEISSSTIRQKVKTGASINYLVPEAVKKYIGREGLYQDDK